MQALLDTSDRVLMDVRSLSERNQGCRFELEQLVWRLPSDALVLVVDKGTDVSSARRRFWTAPGGWPTMRTGRGARAGSPSSGWSGLDAPKCGSSWSACAERGRRRVS